MNKNNIITETWFEAKKKAKIIFERDKETYFKGLDGISFTLKILEFRTNYLKKSNSVYHFFSKFYNQRAIFFNVKLKDEENDFILKVLRYFYNPNSLDEDIIRNFREEIIECEILEFKKQLVNNLVNTVNSDISHKIKLPKFEGFDNTLYEELYNSYYDLLNKNNKAEDDLFRLKQIELDLKYTNELLELDKKNLQEDKEDINYRLNKYKIENEENFENHIKFKSKYEAIKKINENLKYELSRTGNYYVNQFDNLLWGDNYPAMKVLFNFLKDRSLFKYNWSYFCQLMNRHDPNPIELSLNNYTNTYRGVLFKKLYTFFEVSFPYEEDYKVWIIKKIKIPKSDDKRVSNVIDKKFFTKYYRSNKGSAPNTNSLSKNQEKEINTLIEDIKSRYLFIDNTSITISIQ